MTGACQAQTVKGVFILLCDLRSLAPLGDLLARGCQLCSKPSIFEQGLDLAPPRMRTTGRLSAVLAECTPYISEAIVSHI